MEWTCINNSLASDTEYCKKSIDFTYNHSDAIKRYATMLNVSFGSIAGILAEESNSYFSSAFSESKNHWSDQYAIHNMDIPDASLAYGAGGILGFIAYARSGVLSEYRSHEDWETLYKSAVDAGFSYIGPQELDKIRNPVLMDLGKANFKMATAIQLIDDYLLANPSDELLLGKYQSDYALLAQDLVNDENEIVVKLYGLMAVEAEDFFLDHAAYGDEWTALPVEFRDALLVTYFNFGKEKMQSLYDEKTINGTLPYEPLPGMSDGGGMNHLGNIRAIGEAMGEPSYGDNVDSVSDFSQYTEGAAGLAYRYALYKLRPVVLTSLDYSVRDPDGTLEELSASWLADRQQMLSLRVTESRIADTDFIDHITVENDDIHGDFRSIFRKKIIFGGQSAEQIEGGLLDDRIYGTGGTDLLLGNAGDDLLDGGADNDILDGGRGLNHLDGGTGTGDVFRFEGDFGSALVTDSDGGQITLNGSALSVRRMDGAAGTDGMFLFVDADGMPLQGKEDWMLSVSGGSATLFARNSAGDMQIIVADDFDWNNLANQYGITVEAPAAPTADPAQVAALTVGDGRVYWEEIIGHPDDDPFVGRSINYDASTYQYHYGAEVDPDTNHVTGPVAAEEMAGPVSYFFNGNNRNDVLNGSHWSDQQLDMLGQDGTSWQPLIVSNGDSDNPDNWIGDVLFGLDGDDILTGDGKRAGETDYQRYGDDDFLVGGKGNDRLYGGGGDDTLIAWQNYVDAPVNATGLEYDTEKYDSVAEALYHRAITIESVDETNLLDGGDGNDFLYGASYNDTLYGGNGADLIFAGAGRDTILAGNDNDVVFGDSFAVTVVDGTTTRDFIAPDIDPAADDFSRAYFYRHETDMTTAFAIDEHYDDVIDGGNGSDYIYGEIGDDRISGGGGSDLLFGDRPYSAGHFKTAAAGFQPLSADFHGEDVIDGGDGHDRIIGGGDDDLLSGSHGDDILYGDVALGVYDFKSDTTITKDPEQPVRASDAGWWGNDRLLGGAGNDTLVGEGGADLLDGGDGADLIWGDWTGSQGNAVSDSAARTGDDVLYGRAGNDQLIGGGGNDTVYGGSDNDVLVGDNVAADGKKTGTGADLLYGEAGDDWLYGVGGNDILQGGTGNDYLDGGSGDDTYIYIAGDGIDTIRDIEGTSLLALNSQPLSLVYANNLYTLTLSADQRQRIQMDAATFTRMKVAVNGSDIALTTTLSQYSPAGGDVYGSAGNDHYVLDDQATGAYRIYDAAGDTTLSVGSSWMTGDYLDITWVNAVYGVPRVQVNHANDSSTFAQWKVNEWLNVVDIYSDSGSPLNLRLTGNADSNHIEGKSGSDRLEGGNGCDVLAGGAGNDILVDTGKLDSAQTRSTLRNSADSLSGGDGDDQLWAGDDSDQLYAGTGNDFLYGEAGDDQLWGDTGNDYLDGGEGFDRLEGGDGNDHFYSNDFHRQDVFVGGTGNDRFELDTGGRFLLADDIFDGDTILAQGAANQIHIDSYGLEIRDALDDNQVLAAARWSDQSVDNFDWERLAGLSVDLADGTHLDMAAIKSRVFAGSHRDDVIIGDRLDNSLQGQAGNDQLYGMAGTDVLDGGAGSDHLAGGSGTDSYRFGVGYGNDTASESDWDHDADNFVFDASVAASDLALAVTSGSQGTDSLQLTLKSSGDTLLLDGFLDATGPRQRQQRFQFANGEAWDLFRIERELFRSTSRLAVYGTATTGNNTLNGNSSSNYLFGDNGDDQLYGNGGNDWLDGGAGNDLLAGGAGADTFRFGAGGGHDRISDASSVDRLWLDFNTALADITVQLSAASQQITLARRGADGAVTDSVSASNALGRIVDVAGRDVVVASRPDGTDLTLTELCNGQLLSSTFTLTQHNSDSRYVVLSAADILGEGFSAAELARWQIVDAVPTSGQFGIDGSDVDTDGNAAEPAFFFLENYFGDGTNHIAFQPAATAGDGSFRFTLRRDDGFTLVSDMAVNTLSDTVLRGNAGNNILDGGQSDITLQMDGGAGDDVLRDGYGDDVLHGGDGNDVLSYNWGGNGHDVYYGDAGNDTLDAGWGIDTLVGGTGNDHYIEGNLWSGDHTVIDNTTAAADDHDSLQIGQQGYGLADYHALWFSQDGDDLLITQLDALEPGEIRVRDWFGTTNPEARLDVIRVQQDDGTVYEAAVNAQFDALVQAMAGFAPPTGVGAIDPSLADEYQAAWQLSTPQAA